MNQQTKRKPVPSKDTAGRIIKLIEASPIAKTTRQICDALNITLWQFQGARPYMTGYKTVGWYWYGEKDIQAVKCNHNAQKRLLLLVYWQLHYKNKTSS